MLLEFPVKIPTGIPSEHKQKSIPYHVAQRHIGKRHATIKNYFWAGLYGDLQGIAGRAMPEIESLDVLMIEEVPGV